MNRCAFPHCRRHADSIYLDRSVCPEHLGAVLLCQTDSREERRILRVMGLARVNGEVIDADDPRAVEAVADEMIERGVL